MSDLWVSLVRQTALKVVGFAVIVLAGWGLDLPKAYQDKAIIVAVTAGLWAWSVAVRWLETRAGDGTGARLARLLARVLMLGVAATPRYSAPAPVRQSGMGGGAPH